MRVCAEPTCSTLVPGPGRCAVHKLKRRSKERKPEYGSDWAAVSRAYRLAHPECELHLDGCAIVARDVDHVVPLEEGGARLDWANLQSVCRPCHRRKSHADAQRRTERYGAMGEL